MEKLLFKLEVFEGPLDLLLHLISKNKLDIYDINITELLSQYLEYIRNSQENTTEIASEFLEMASRLVYIKSLSLLPRHDEADELKDSLSGELLEYQVCKMLAKKLSQMTDGFNCFVREPTDVEPDRTYRLTHQSELLLTYYLAAVGRGMRRMPPSESSFKEIVERKIISVSSKIVYLLRNLWKGNKIKYKTLFNKSESRSDAVATFLAILELIKANRITVKGDEQNPDIEMVKTKS